MPVVDTARLDAVFKAYDIRGLVGKELDDGLLELIGAAAAEVLAHASRRMVVGHDMRTSSPRFADAFARGVTSRGVDVIEIGLASTDQLYYASGVFDVPGAMFTASHNPSEYNGVKLCRAGAAPVGVDTGLDEIRRLALAGLPPAAAGQGSRVREDVTTAFAAHVRSFVDAAGMGSVRVAVDAGNGMAGHLWPLVADSLPISTTPLYFELDGRFPNHPANPLDPANLVDVQAAVREGGHHLGLAFDGDADRVFAIDETGGIVPSSLVGAVIAERLLRRDPGATVLYNLICSQIVPEVIRGAGGRAVRTRVGHSYVKQRMAETDAIFAVEHSGHFYFRDNFRADSGLIAAMVLMEAVAEVGRPLSEVVAPYDRYAATGERNVASEDPARLLEDVARAYAGRGELDREDGLTVVTEGGWFNLRPSNTEPFLRLNIEADDEPTLRRLTAEVERLLASA